MPMRALLRLSFVLRCDNGRNFVRRKPAQEEEATVKRKQCLVAAS